MECGELLALFARDIVQRGGERLFGRRTALRFLDACDDNGFYVVAVEGFRVMRNSAARDPNWIADYSSWCRGAPRDTIRRARRLIEHAPDEMSFSLVVRRS
jgi:hypothetical protein